MIIFLNKDPEGIVVMCLIAHLKAHSMSLKMGN